MGDIHHDTRLVRSLQEHIQEGRPYRVMMGSHVQHTDLSLSIVGCSVTHCHQGEKGGPHGHDV